MSQRRIPTTVANGPVSATALRSGPVPRRAGAAPVLGLLSVVAALMGAVPAQAQSMRPEVGRPLQQAGDLLRAGKAREALAKAREADAAAGKTAAEQLVIDRMKAAAAQRAGDGATAIQALESVYGRVGEREQGQIAEQIASAYAQQRNNARASEWVAKAVAAGNTGPTVRQLQGYLQTASGDYSAIAREAAGAVAAAEQAGRRPEEGDLLRLADAQQRTSNPGGQIATLEKLVAHYPKKDYWNAYLGRLVRKPGFSDRFALDVLRVKLASGVLTRAEDFMEFAQLSLQAGLPAEALRVFDQGTKAGVLGTGPEAARQQRLRELILKQLQEQKAALPGQAAEAAGYKEGEGLVKAGYAYASLGEIDKGVSLIQQGIAKGSLKRPEDARLRLGMAQLQSPRTKAAGLQTLRAVKGTDGVADIARLWTVLGT